MKELKGWPFEPFGDEAGICGDGDFGGGGGFPG